MSTHLLPDERRDMERFKQFLVRHGAQLLKPTNEYEVLRFKSNGVLSIVYTGRRGISMVGEAEDAYDAFKKSTPWRGCERGNKNQLKVKQVKDVTKRTLLERDGDGCFYCWTPMPPEDISIEHLLSLTQGGNSHVANLALAHVECNQQAAHLSVMEKIKLREARRIQR